MKALGRKALVWTLFAALAPLARPQMEKRDGDLYDREKFLAAAPAVGTAAPELVSTDLDGRQHKLSEYRGRVVVLIKGGFT
jgi:hypothetical protein